MCFSHRLSALDSSSTNKSKQLPDEQAVLNDNINLPSTLTELPVINQAQPDRIEGVSVEQNVVVVSETYTSTAAESLELGCNDEGLIVVQVDSKPIERDASRVVKDESQAARSK